jgi:hypothetical protein
MSIFQMQRSGMKGVQEDEGIKVLVSKVSVEEDTANGTNSIQYEEPLCERPSMPPDIVDLPVERGDNIVE